MLNASLISNKCNLQILRHIARKHDLCKCAFHYLINNSGEKVNKYKGHLQANRNL